VEELERSGEVELLGSPSVDWLGVPLKTQRGDTIGAMTVQSYNETIRLGEEDKEILIFVSSQVAMVIERKQAEEALQESEERYRRLVENAPLGILSADPQGRIVAVNPALLAMLGSPSVEATRQINMLTFPPLVEAGIAGDMFVAALLDAFPSLASPMLAEVAKVGFDPLYGARPLKRAIQQQIENPVARLVLEGRFGPKDVIPVDFRKGEFTFERIVH